MAMVGVAGEEVSFGDTVIGGDQFLRLPINAREMGLYALGEGGDINGVVVVGWQGSQCGLPAKALERVEDLVLDGRSGRGAVMGIKRHDEQARNAFLQQGVDLVGDGWRSVAHGPVAQEPWLGTEALGELFTLRTGEGAQRTFVFFCIPYGAVGFCDFRGSSCKDQAMEDGPPDQSVGIDDAFVHEELFEIGAYGSIGRIGRRAEVDDEQADAPVGNGRMAFGARVGYGFAHALR